MHFCSRTTMCFFFLGTIHFFFLELQYILQIWYMRYLLFKFICDFFFRFVIVHNISYNKNESGYLIFKRNEIGFCGRLLSLSLLR